MQAERGAACGFAAFALSPSLALGTTPELCKLAVEALRSFKEGSVPCLLVP
jgi:hypothetical protein